MMRAFFLGVVLLLVGLAPAVGDPPFSPTADVPDYVVTSTERAIHRREGLERIVYRHGDWTRVDIKAGGGSSSTYYQRDCRGSVQLYRDHTGEVRTLAIRRGCYRSPIYDYNAVRTDEQQSVAGERCTVWSTRRSKPSVGLTLNYTSCVTDDGIELWYKAIGSRGDVITSVEATAVDRRPVEAAEAQPPADLLKIDGWFTETGNAPDRGGQSDFEIVMQRDDGSAATQTMRQRGHWMYEEETGGGVLKSMSVRNAARGLGFAVTNLDADIPVLSLETRSQADLAQIAAAVERMKPEPLGRHEIVLGERCEWFNISPGMMDAWHSACRTDDGITLKAMRGGRGRADQTDVAIRLARRPIALDEIKPLPALLERKTWDLPD